MRKKLLSVAILAALSTTTQAAVVLDPDASGATYFEDSSGSPVSNPLEPTYQLSLGGLAPGTLEVNASGSSTELQRRDLTLRNQGELRVIGNGSAGSAAVNLGSESEATSYFLVLDDNSRVDIRTGGQLTASGQYTWATGVTLYDGEITVDGSGSLLSATSLSMAETMSDSSPKPSLTISNGAHAEFYATEDLDSYIGTPFPYESFWGDSVPITASALVTGGGSQLDVAHTLFVSNGQLTILDGATADLGSLVLNDVAGTGALTQVSGAGSQLNVSGVMNVGSDSFEGGTVTVSDDGLLSASSLNLLSGALLNGDDGTVAADVVMNGGTIAPGESTGSMTIDGNLDWADGLLEIEIASLSDFDQLNVLGSTTLGADSEVLFSFVDDFMPEVGDMFEFLLTDSLLGDLSMLDFVVMGLGSSDLAFSLIETDGGLALYTGSGAAPVPLPAAFWLFFAGIGAALSMARRQSGSNQQASAA